MAPLPLPQESESNEIAATLVGHDDRDGKVILSIVMATGIEIKLKLDPIAAQSLAQALNVEAAYLDIPRKGKAELIN